MARKIVRKSKGGITNIKSYQEAGEVIDVMGEKYTRTDTGKKVSEDTYIDYAMEFGYTPSKKQAKKYKRNIKRKDRKSKRKNK